MSYNHIVIVGASLAGLRAAETLRRDGFSGHITMIGDETEKPYDRPPLSKEILQGTMASEDLAFQGATALDVDWKLGHAATRLNADDKEVHLASGEVVSYDALLLATGSRPRRLSNLDPAHPAIHEIRTLNDSLKLRSRFDTPGPVLVIGCGFVGVETASSLRANGKEVIMVDPLPPLNVAGPLVSQRASELISEADIRHYRASVDAVDFAEAPYQVHLNDGTTLYVEDVLVAIGAVPNVSWLEGSGAVVDNGVLCDKFLQVQGIEDVYAAGDIVRWPNAIFGEDPMRVEHWSNAVEQGMAAARNMLRPREERVGFQTVPSFWSEHFGSRLQSVGLPQRANNFKVTAGDSRSGPFCAEAYRDNQLVGAVAYDMPKELIKVRLHLARSGASVAQATG